MQLTGSLGEEKTLSGLQDTRGTGRHSPSLKLGPTFANSVPMHQYLGGKEKDLECFDLDSSFPSLPLSQQSAATGEVYLYCPSHGIAIYNST